MASRRHTLALALPLSLLAVAGAAASPPGATEWTPLPVAEDPLVRMPGTQPGAVMLESPDRCLNCHDGYDPVSEPGSFWRGSMMAHAARDFLFWPCLTVAAQDSIWALGRPNATDICLRCHFPMGWLEGRSDPTNGSVMTGDDFDGVQCDFCHRMIDPFFAATHDGSREGDDWAGYWDESGLSDTPSQQAADVTRSDDAGEAALIDLYDGDPFFVGDRPHAPAWDENGSGQYFVAVGDQKRGPFADATGRHAQLYSRYHKSKYFCSTCHDVSNPAFANLAFDGTPPGDGLTVLPTEEQPAYSFFHVERTFSEFMLSAYGAQGGAPGLGPFAPDVFDTSTPDDFISRCQDCHLPDVAGRGCDKQDAPLRPDGSVEHPTSGVPQHDMTGGNAFVGWVLASAVPGSPNYDPVNEALLRQGPGVLTLDLDAGLGLDAETLLDAADRALATLAKAAAIEAAAYDPATGIISFRVQNQTGHKLISGFPEGRRLWLNVQVFHDGALVEEINPYDPEVATLKGLPDSPSSPPLGPGESYVDELVYEMHPSSSLTGEEKTFHFVLADGRYKDNRIPPKGFRSAEMDERLAGPVWQGTPAPDLFTAAEYAGGYDQVDLDLVPDADRVEVRLYYQTTSREYMEFLRDEIAGTADTLPPEAYVIQSDPFFDQLRAWDDTLWQLWEHNKDVPGAAPVQVAEAVVGGGEEPGPDLAVSGTCPGALTITVSDATPGGSVPLVRGTTPGSFVLPAGNCAGTELGLSDPQLLRTFTADGDGGLTLAVTAPESACGLYLQALDLATCQPSNLAQLP